MTGTTALRFNRLNSSSSTSNSADNTNTTETKAEETETTPETQAEATETTPETVTAEGPTATTSTETTAADPSAPTESTTSQTQWSKSNRYSSRYPGSKHTKRHPRSETKDAASNAAERARSVLKTGTVVSAGRMERCVKVAERSQIWDAHIRKFYPKVTTYLVADPRNSLREGDVIRFSSGYRKTRNVRHVVENIVAAFGTPFEERPPVMTYREREDARREALKEKYIRKAEREGKVFPEGEEVKVPEPKVGKIKSLVRERMAMIRKREHEERLMRKERKEELRKEREGNALS